MSRTLLIGLDGATFTVLDHLIAQKGQSKPVMPCLRRLVERGVRAPLRSTPNPLTPPAWVSLMTGRTPGHHGVFDFLRAEERGSDVYFTLTDARDVRTEMIWSIASRQDRTVAALNFPITAPPRPIIGSLVPGFVPWKHLRRNVYPRELFDRLRGLEGFDPKKLAWDFELESKAMDVMDARDLEQWVRYHIEREEQWFRIAEKLLIEDNPDLMAVMFDGTDKIQHQAWEFLLPRAASAASAGEWETRIRSACIRYFTKLDEYIERLVSLAGADVQVFLASDHGFTGSHEVVRINTFLHDKGYLAWREQDGSASRERRQRSWFADLDWAKTLAYCRTPSSNGITIRVARSPGDSGIRPHEYHAFRERLIADLRELRDPDSGEQVIVALQKREDAFPGAAMESAPDISLVLRDFGFVSIANARPTLAKRQTVAGTHHPDGIFIASGHGIAQSRRIERCNITDVCATLLYSLGLPIPADLEGEVADEVFTTEYRSRHRVRRGSPTLPVNPDSVASAAMKDAEKTKIIRQLQMLGYME